MTPVEHGELRPGQRFAARVLEVLESGDALLEFGQNRAVVPASSGLQVGDRVVLEVVVGGGQPELRMITASPATSRQLSAGQRLEAHVLETLPGGEVLLAFGERRAVVPTSDPWQAGDRVTLEVVAGGVKPELRIVTDHTAATSPSVAGQRLEARVLEMLASGDVLLTFGQSRAVVPTSHPLQPGDRVALDVVTVGVQPEYRVVKDDAAPALSYTAGNTPAGQPLAAGQRVEAHVLGMLPNGDVRLLVGQDQAVAPTSRPLQTGDRIVLEVVTAGVNAEFSIVADAAAKPQPATRDPSSTGLPGVAPLSPHDLPVILRALAEAVPRAVPMADALQEFFRAAAALDVRASVVDQMQRLVAPLNAALPPEALAGMIRTFLAQSGLFTENHLRSALQHAPLAFTPDQQQAVPDLRLLLGQLTTADTPVADPVRAFGEALLQQQLVVAERLAGTGVGHITIPFTFGEQQVDVVLEWEREARRVKGDGPNQAITVSVFVYLPTLGAIETRVDWKADSVAVTFYVEREVTRAIVEAGLADFTEQLSRAGCPAVSASVWLNPGRAASATSAVKKAIVGGTILDVTA